ncbi:MAG: PEGA domain-containing protein [Elusimicrobiota bacterium]
MTKKIVLILILFLNTALLAAALSYGYTCLSRKGPVVNDSVISTSFKNDKIAGDTGILVITKPPPVQYREEEPEDTGGQDADPVEKTGPAKINIKTDPEGSKVFVNGYYKGKTPVEFDVFSVDVQKEYKLVLMRQDGSRWEEDIELHPGQILDLDIELKDRKNETE